MEWFLILVVVALTAAVLHYRTKKRLEAEQALQQAHAWWSIGGKVLVQCSGDTASASIEVLP